MLRRLTQPARPLRPLEAERRAMVRHWQIPQRVHADGTYLHRMSQINLLEAPRGLTKCAGSQDAVEELRVGARRRSDGGAVSWRACGSRTWRRRPTCTPSACAQPSNEVAFAHKLGLRW